MKLRYLPLSGLFKTPKIPFVAAADNLYFLNETLTQLLGKNIYINYYVEYEMKQSSSLIIQRYLGQNNRLLGQDKEIS